MKNLRSTTFLIICTLLLLAFTVSAKSVSLGFNIGQVISAELSSVKLEVTDREKFPYPNQYRNQKMVILTLKMYPRRSISPLDYDLVINGATSKCLSAVCNMEQFVSNPSVLYPENTDLIRMLFVFDGSRIKAPGKGKVVRATLRCNLKNRSNVTFNVTDLGNGNFTDTAKIPAAGSLK